MQRAEARAADQLLHLTDLRLTPHLTVTLANAMPLYACLKNS